MEAFRNSENVILNQPIFINQVMEENSMKILRDASLLDATYDAGVREFAEDIMPSPRSYNKLVDDLSFWSHQPDPLFSTLCFIGQKSDLAQRCAERLDSEGQLAASFLFSRERPTIDDPTRFFPTICYQLTTRFAAYKTAVETILRHDPCVLHKSLKVQFRELIARPLEDLIAPGQTFGSINVIIVEGLEERKSERARREILRILTMSTGTLPLRWAIFSHSRAEIETQISKWRAVDMLCWEARCLEMQSLRRAKKDIAFQNGVAVIQLGGRYESWVMNTRIVAHAVCFFFLHLDPKSETSAHPLYV
ncbi:hypothetical protein AN958_07077 [Leucoagaricus sp. SymC.cos]|nr:hypothetical protein AN958_07077 [Leucoagaricus sp. SymC.cos]